MYYAYKVAILLYKKLNNKQSGYVIFRTVTLIYVLRVEFGLTSYEEFPLALLLSIVTKLFLYPNQIENVCWPCKTTGTVTLIILKTLLLYFPANTVPMQIN